MKGVSDMKKIVGVLKILLLYLIGYIIFTSIIFLIEVLFLWKLSGGVFNVYSIFTRSINNHLLTYSIVFLVIFVANIIYNYVSVRRLNGKLNKMKKG